MDDLVKVNNFNAFQSLSELDNGNLSFEFTKKLKELLASIKEVKKSGSITLKINIEPMPDFGEYALKVIPNIDVKLPKENYESSLRFVSKENDLIHDDPKQLLIKGILTTPEGN